jgi:Prp8 binding protein
MAAEKRAASGDYSSSQMVVKRPNLGDGKAVSRVNGSGANGALIQAAPRTSGLQAPVMELTGHSGEVFCAKFDPNGNYIASGSMDRSISE